MKLKQRPSDFRVEEFSTVVPQTSGPFAFYRLEKSGWTTPDTLAFIRQRWKIDARRLAFGGLKDRHAHTIQYLTIHNGPERNLQHDAFEIRYLGRTALAYSSDRIRANGFTLVLRDLTPADVAHVEAMLPEVAEVGVPNYFDDQRFGSVNEGQQFIAKELVLGRFEEALRLALLAPYEHDRNQAKREKAILAANWNDWPRCVSELPKGHAREIAQFLQQHPGDFRGACVRLQPDLQGLYLAAWQGHLWNRMLFRWIARHVPVDRCLTMRLRTGTVLMPRSLDESTRAIWETLSLPLPSARLKFDPLADWAPVVSEVMTEEGIPLSEMRIKNMRQPFFSKGDRLARVPVDGLSLSTQDDEFHPGRLAIELKFELPRGCYATMVVKRLTADLA